jgi:hypothetical protein
MALNLVYFDTHVRIELVDGNAAQYIELAPTQIESLIHELSNMRRQMRPEVPRTIPEGVQPKCDVDPLWSVQVVPMTEADKVVFFRSAGLGWISFALPQIEASKLAAALMVRQSLPPAPTQTRQ